MFTPLLQTFAANCSTSFLGFKAWYAYLQLDGSCSITRFNLLPGSDADGKFVSDVPLILLAVVDDLLRLAGLAAVMFVIWGAVQYVTSQGNPEEASKAQSTIQNALVGLAVAIIAVAAVSFLGARLAK